MYSETATSFFLYFIPDSETASKSVNVFELCILKLPLRFFKYFITYSETASKSVNVFELLVCVLKLPLRFFFIIFFNSWFHFVCLFVELYKISPSTGIQFLYRDIIVSSRHWFHVVSRSVSLLLLTLVSCGFTFW